MVIVCFLLSLLALPSYASSYISSPGSLIDSPLREYAIAQKGMSLNLRLVVGREQEAQMVLDDFQVEFESKCHNFMRSFKTVENVLPPNFSSGAFSLRVQKKPSFISMRGLEHAQILNSCWEMVWHDGAVAGTIVCAFDVSKECSRSENSDVSLPSGRLYIGFPVWTKDGLAQCQVYKQEVMDRAKKCIKSKDDELDKMNGTSNPFLKVLYFLNAYAALTKFQRSEVGMLTREMAHIPLEDVRPIQNGLFISSRGTMWKKETSSKKEQQVLVGHALIRQVFV
mmetsp:Transcript_18599/g.27291  ORF Transcript_18599/g.27291 Transcript_18599/m.27291 type:complete len:282 (+) Transcript_18599:62-907(+)|eukprot:CAMPEP_0195509076 /NCGR_PEP_ID=MMETSP0794_2-20130614/2103_1 /TAXON_ID=515487 /ORGANISM="Stephanopyxis turris, Strain CCMP 815" /LENGTH=281 /DNA_ID=CAMNT_0040636197 /DNA_START=51 /DNA_END=896 /DNA_ORIENTATION=+